MESIAIYWEKQVKVYGITLRRDLMLIGLQFKENEPFSWHSLLSHTEPFPMEFELLASLPDNSNGQLLSIVVDQTQLLLFQSGIEERTKRQLPSFTISYKKVEMIYLHGPHFQERFGILSRTLAPLYKNNIEPVITGCAGNSMYIVVQDGLGVQCAEILQNTFQIPSSS